MIDEALQRAIGGDAGAHQRRRLIDRQRVIVEQIFGVRHQHMGGKAAVDGDAEEALLDAEVLVAGETVAALAAANPGKYRLLLADHIHADLGADLIDDAGELMAERKWERHAARGVELLAAAEIGIAVLDVQVGMTEPATLDANEDLLALRLRRFDDGLAERRIEFDQRLSTHLRHVHFSLYCLRM